MKKRLGIALILITLTLSLTTVALTSQNSPIPAYMLTKKMILQQPTQKISTIAWEPEKQVNTWTQSYQDTPSICCFPNGGYVVAWSSYNQSGDETYDVYAKLFNSIGQNVTIEFRVNQNTTNHQGNPSVCCFPDGSGFVITWNSKEQDGEGWGVFAQIYDDDGNRQNSTDIPVNGYNKSDQRYPSVCCLSDGVFVVTWQSQGQDTNLNGVYAKLFNSTTGKNMTDDIQVNTNTTNDQDSPSVCCFDNNSFVVAWESRHSGNNDAYVKLFNSSGSALTSDIIVNTNTTNDQDSPSVCCVGNESFMVAWRSKQNNEGDIYIKFFNSSGSALTGDIMVNSYTTLFQGRPSIGCFDNGSFVVAWTSDEQVYTGSDYDIYAKVFNSSGSALTGEVLANNYTESGQDRASVCCRSDGSFVVVWQSTGQDGSFSGIYLRVGSVKSLATPPILPLLFIMQSESGVNTPLLVGGVLVVAVIAGALVYLWFKRGT